MSVEPYRSRLLLPRALPFSDPAERRWYYNYRGAGGPWLPVNLPGIGFWGSADSATVDGGGNLTAWPSLVGSASGSPSASAPTVVTVNGRKWVRFTAASSQYVSLDSLAAALSGEDKAYTVALSLTLATPSLDMAYWSIGRADTSVNPYDARGIDLPAGTWWHDRRDDAASAVSVHGTATADTDAHVIVDTFAGTTTSHYIDGVADYEDEACDVGSMTIGRMTIGARKRSSTVDRYLGADIRQVVIVPGRAISADERAKLTAYLADDAGVSLA